MVWLTKQEAMEETLRTMGTLGTIMMGLLPQTLGRELSSLHPFTTLSLRDS